MLKPGLNSTFGINVAGHVSGDFGLAEGVRGNLRAIETTKIPFSITDFKIPWQTNSDRTYTQFGEENPYPINLIHTNPDWLEKILEGYFPGVTSADWKDKYSIGYWAWELPVFPAQWMWAFDLFDEIWTPSNFCAEAISAISPIPVIKIPHSLSFPKPSMSRETLGLPQNTFIFLFCFDFASSFERKNPFAAIEAFQKSFSQDNREVSLILKFSTSHVFPELRDKLYNLAEGWDSIHLIDKHLEKQELHGLVANCDCYISLHRAEGFGLTMAEAMYYGKPVIATGYSANMEFMNYNNSFPVRYQLVKTSEDYGAYPKGSIWSEPEIDHAVSLMKYVFDNQEESRKVGERATEDIKSLLSPHVIGKKIKNRLEWINTRLTTTNSSSYLYKLQAERDWFQSQAEAWKKTALTVQNELKSKSFEFKR